MLNVNSVRSINTSTDTKLKFGETAHRSNLTQSFDLGHKIP